MLIKEVIKFKTLGSEKFQEKNLNASNLVAS
jgi:hypothetical protein